MVEPSDAFKLTLTGPLAVAAVKRCHIEPVALPLKYATTEAFVRCSARTETLADARSAA